MSWLKRLVKKIVNLVTGKKDSDPASALQNAVPASAAAAGMGGLPAGVKKAVDVSFQDRNQNEMDVSKSAIAPLPSKIFSDTLADEYDKWFKTLHAGIMVPNPIGLAALKAGLRIFKFASWGTALSVYWTTVVWLPSGIYTGGITTNAVVQAAGLQSEINSMLLSGMRTSDEFANRIATILYTYTTGLTVQATLSVPPNTKVETVK